MLYQVSGLIPATDAHRDVGRLSFDTARLPRHLLTEEARWTVQSAAPPGAHTSKS